MKTQERPRFKKPARPGPTFNREQREGLAKSLDSLGTAFIIGVTVGSFAEKISVLGAVLISLGALFLYCTAFFLRGLKE